MNSRPTQSPGTQCTQCGAALAAEDAICPACDSEFERSQSGVSGKHICPACGARFNAPLLAYRPANVRWYKFAELRPQCPHCKGILHDRRQPKVSTKSVVLLAVGLLVTELAWPPHGAAVYANIVVLWLVARSFRLERSIPEESRYGTDKPS